MNIPTNGRDPFKANRERCNGRHLDRSVRVAFRITGTANRKRKKAVYKAERANYRELLIAVMEQHYARDQQAKL